MIKLANSQKIISIFLITIVFFFYFFELGSLDGLRQGTEGFYLKIADEMYRANSWLEPLYNGERHWSKPPFQFWLAQFFFLLFGKSSLFISRLSISIFTLSSIYLFSVWMQSQFKIKKIKGFLFIASSLAFFKYGRIFMMEMPLAILSAGSYLAFYNYFDTNEKKSFIIGSILLGFSILVKGPVSLVMVMGGLCLFSVYIYKTQKRVLIKELLYVAIAGILIASPWFLYSTYKYGQEFINYFFLRENMGKFSSKSYPIRVVFQGLFLYALPWSLYLPNILSKYKNEYNNPRSIYIFVGFICFFFLWLIPNQRSHHYAIPSIPLFLVFALYKIDSAKIHPITKKLHLSFVVLLLTFVILFTYITNTLLPGNVSNIALMFILLSTLIYFFTVYREKGLVYISVAHLATVGLIWLVLIPSVVLPKMPDEVIKLIAKNKLSVVVAKPYFISQALGREVSLEFPGTIKGHIQESNEFYLVHENLYHDKNLKNETEIIYKWTIWRRGPKTREIIDALSSKKVQKLQDSLVLLRKK